MQNVKTWNDLKIELLNSMDEIELDNYEILEKLYDDIKIYFDNKPYKKEELEDAKILITSIEMKINEKIEIYNMEMDESGRIKKGFLQYFNN